MRKIYFDNAATTACDEAVLAVMLPYFTKEYGNPASVHNFGREAQKALDESREMVAHLLGVDSDQVIFTSGASESNNQVLEHFSNTKIITTNIEHSSVNKKVLDLREKGSDVSMLSPNELLDGDPTDLFHKESLVSVMHVNNETGLIIDTRILNEKRSSLEEQGNAFIHSDIVQAWNLFDATADSLGVDFLTLSAHKFYGPKGIGALITPKDFKLSPHIIGGSQEYGKRAGTVNIPGVIGFAKALEISAGERGASREKIEDISGYFKNEARKRGAILMEDRFPKADFSPHIVNLSFSGMSGEEVAQFLDMNNVAVSRSSACSSGSTERSHVLLAMGLTEDEVDASLRFSFGKHNSRKEVDYCMDVLDRFLK